MTFDKKIRLLKLKKQNGGNGYITVTFKDIWANVREVGVTTQYTAAAAGHNAELQAICHRAEYETNSFTHAEYNGRCYHIERTGTADTDRHIKLMLEKGG